MAVILHRDTYPSQGDPFPVLLRKLVQRAKTGQLGVKTNLCELLNNLEPPVGPITGYTPASGLVPDYNGHQPQLVWQEPSFTPFPYEYLAFDDTTVERAFWTKAYPSTFNQISQVDVVVFAAASAADDIDWDVRAIAAGVGDDMTTLPSNAAIVTTTHVDTSTLQAGVIRVDVENARPNPTVIKFSITGQAQTATGDARLIGVYTRIVE